MFRVSRCFAILVSILVAAACGGAEPDPTGAGGVGGQGGAAGAGGSANAGSGGGANDGSVGGADAAGGSDASIDGGGGSPDTASPDGTGGREDTSVVIDGDQADRVVTGDMTIVDSAADFDPGTGRRNRRRPLSGRSATADPARRCWVHAPVDPLQAGGWSRFVRDGHLRVRNVHFRESGQGVQDARWIERNLLRFDLRQVRLRDG